MKRCSLCGREVPESATATTCSQCDDQSVALVRVAPSTATSLEASAPQPAPVAPAVPPAAPAVPPAVALVAPAVPAVTRAVSRPMFVAILLIVAGGTLAFAMLRTSSPPAVRAVVPTTPKPAAPKAPTPAAAPAANMTAAPGMAPTITPTWKAANQEWLLNARKGVAFELPSLAKVAVWQGISQPMIVVRCNAGQMQTFVYTSSALQMEAQDENHSVSIRFDDEPEVTERWADSSDHDALFAPDAAAFARRVASARTLRFGYTPHNAPRAVAEFQVSGLADLLQPAAKQCGWK
jgi:hypothetical protein